MRLWGVVRTGSTQGDLSDRLSPLGSVLGGLVLVPAVGARNGHLGPLDGSLSGDLLLGLRDVPADVDAVSMLDADSAVDETLEALRRMTECLEHGADAVVRGEPVTDALKRVDGDGTVIGDVDRTGLFVPRTPQLIRRGALDAALRTSPHELGPDPATLLIRCGYDVRVLWGAAHPARDAQRARG